MPAQEYLSNYTNRLTTIQNRYRLYNNDTTQTKYDTKQIYVIQSRHNTKTLTTSKYYNQQLTYLSTKEIIPEGNTKLFVYNAN